MAWKSLSMQAVESSPLGPFNTRLEKVLNDVVGFQYYPCSE